MNIFYLDEHPILAAQYHCDKHVVKMILESAQMLCTAHYKMFVPSMYQREYTGKLQGIDLYKPTHKNHPCTKWVCESKQNYWYLYELFLALCDEYTHRYNKIHLSDKKFRAILGYIPNGIQDFDFTQPAQAMPDRYKNDCSVSAYRDYYINEKSHIAKWTKRDAPYWW
jgi:hypothetical protein